MASSFKERVRTYLGWRFKKSRQSSRFVNGMTVILLSAGLLGISALHEAPAQRRQYDQKPFAHYPITLPCKVNRIIDGDSIIAECPIGLKSNKTSLRSIRVWGIDAPETGQAYWGDFATKTLKNIIGKHNTITFEILSQDRYKRSLSRVYIKDLDVGLEMVKRGAAVVYHRYNSDENYISTEKKAKMMRLGIWQKPGAQQNPERWRRFNP